MEELFLKFIRKSTVISQEDVTAFLSYFQVKNFKRNAVLLAEGDIANEAYIVLNGGLRQFFSAENGLEKTCNFIFEGEFFTDLESFSRKSRAATTIVTLEPTECLVITCKDLVEAMQQSPAIAELCRTIVENIATAGIKRIQSFLSLSPENHFKELLHQNPQLLQRVPQRYIAQYLGLAPESLSRIRKRMMIAE